MRRRPPYLIWPLDGIKLLLTFAALVAVFAGVWAQGSPSAQPRPTATVLAPSTRAAVLTPTRRPTATSTPQPTPMPIVSPTVSPTAPPTATPTPTSMPTAVASPTVRPTLGEAALAITWPEPETTLRTPRPIFRGTGRPGDTVTILDGETALGTTLVDASGRWRFVVAEPLAAGEHVLRAVVKDDQGKVSLESSPLKVSIAP